MRYKDEVLFVYPHRDHVRTRESRLLLVELGAQVWDIWCNSWIPATKAWAEELPSTGDASGRGSPVE